MKRIGMTLLGSVVLAWLSASAARATPTVNGATIVIRTFVGKNFSWSARL